MLIFQSRFQGFQGRVFVFFGFFQGFSAPFGADFRVLVKDDIEIPDTIPYHYMPSWFPQVSEIKSQEPTDFVHFIDPFINKIKVERLDETDRHRN